VLAEADLRIRNAGATIAEVSLLDAAVQAQTRAAEDERKGLEAMRAHLPRAPDLASDSPKFVEIAAFADKRALFESLALLRADVRDRAIPVRKYLSLVRDIGRCYFTTHALPEMKMLFEMERKT
jgi:hypothetical protein